jgi:hypothetical protein
MTVMEPRNIGDHVSLSDISTLVILAQTFQTTPNSSERERRRLFWQRAYVGRTLTAHASTICTSGIKVTPAAGGYGNRNREQSRQAVQSQRFKAVH